jgi:Integrase core domain
MLGRYVDTTQAGSFSGADNFARSIRQDPKSVRRELKLLDAYAQHHPIKKHFPRRRVYVNGINDQWAMDLADIQKQSRFNHRQKFLLCVLDVFSKKAWVEPLARKTGPRVAAALERVFNRAGVYPRSIQADFGTEFYNSNVDRLLKSKGIKLFSTSTEPKCSIAERFIRTFMTKVERYKTHNKTRKFIDKLKDFEWLYNNSYHRSIKMRPSEVTKENEDQVRGNLYDDVETIPIPSFKSGDRVLVRRRKKVFEKGYSHNYLPEVFKVSYAKVTNPCVYVLKDLKGNEITGVFYEQDLLKL